MLIENTEFGTCSKCKAEFNSELMNEYDFDFCPYCGEQLYESVMKEYSFKIYETLVGYTQIKARSKTDAIIQLHDMYDKGELDTDEIEETVLKDSEGKEV